MRDNKLSGIVINLGIKLSWTEGHKRNALSLHHVGLRRFIGFKFKKRPRNNNDKTTEQSCKTTSYQQW